MSCTEMIYSLTHTSPVVGRDLVSKVATTHIASIGVGTILIASMNTQSTFIYVCVVGSCTFEITCTFKLLILLSIVVLCTDRIFSYPHKFCCWKRFGIQCSNCTHSFHSCWYNSDCIHLYPEHIHHVCLCYGS